MKINTQEIFYLARRLREAALAKAVPAGISPPLLAAEMSVINFLAGRPEPATIGEIVQGTSHVQSWVSAIVRRLEKRGWIETSTPRGDKRSTCVLLRREVLVEMRGVLQGQGASVFDHLCHGLSPKNKDAVARGLTVLIRHLEAGDQDPARTSSKEESLRK